MTKQILKTILAGVLAGAAFFLVPFFLLRVIVFALIIGAVFRLLGFGRHRFAGRMNLAFAEKLRNMSDEEWAAFKQRPGNSCRQRRDNATATKL